MEFWHVVGDITILLGVAVLLGIIAERLGISGVVGYLLAGTLVGPGLLNWVTSDEETIRVIAEIGVALLLFTIGLEINGRRLRELLGRGMAMGVLQILVTGSIGYALAVLFGTTPKTAIIVGAMLALSSTAVVVRVLQDRSELDAVHGRLSLSVLLVQDLAIVPIMLLIGLLSEIPDEQVVSMQTSGVGAKLVVLAITTFLIGILIVPRIFGAAIIRRSGEFPAIIGLVTCFSAMWLTHQLNLSPALGAFVAGLILAGSPFAAQVRGDMAPLRHIFLTLFFAATGMLADLPWLLGQQHWLWVVGVALGIVVGKSGIIWVVGMVCKQSRRISIASGLCLAQIGEFSFVIGAAGLKFGLLEDDHFQLMMSSSLLTLLVAPLLIGKARRISSGIDSVLGTECHLESDEEIASLRNHVVVLGYGVAGQQVVAGLLETGNQVLVIDIGPVGVQQARQDGAAAILGNAQRRDILDHAGLTHAKLVVSTLPDHRASSESIEQIRAFASSLPIIARSRYSRHADLLSLAGADIVVDEEECVGKTLEAHALQQLGQ